MKIAYDVMKVSGYSGNQVYTSELIKALLKYHPEHQYHLITHWHTNKRVKQYYGHSDALVYRNLLPSHLILGKAFKNTIASLNQSIQGWVSGSFDLYHCTNPVRFPNQVNNAVVTLHDLIALSEKPWVKQNTAEFYKKNIERILKKAKLVFAVSHYTKSEAIKHFPDIEDKIIVTPLGSNQQFTNKEVERAFLAKYGIKDTQKPYLLYVGELQHRKNVFKMLEAFGSLPKSLINSCNFVFIGKAKVKTIQEEFEQLKEKLKADTNIYQLSGISSEDLINFYNAAEGMVFVSLFEGFGLPVLEAMQCGCPVITSNTTSLTEVAGTAALKVNPEDIEEIRAAMIKLLEDSTLKKELKLKGFKQAKKYSWKKTAELTLEGYKMAISNI